MILQTYKVVQPGRSTSRKLPDIRGTAATALLRSYQPDILDDAIPLSIIGDGNRMFRALSRCLFGGEDSHELIRLLTAIEICECRHHNDTSDSQYCHRHKLIRLLTAVEICECRHHYDTSDTKYCDSVQYVRLLQNSYSYRDLILLTSLRRVRHPVLRQCPSCKTTPRQL